jgi:hypothetical protein
VANGEAPREDLKGTTYELFILAISILSIVKTVSERRSSRSSGFKSSSGVRSQLCEHESSSSNRRLRETDDGWHEPPNRVLAEGSTRECSTGGEVEQQPLGSLQIGNGVGAVGKERRDLCRCQPI